MSFGPPLTSETSWSPLFPHQVLWFPHEFPMIFSAFPLISLSFWMFSLSFSMVSLWFSVVSPSFPYHFHLWRPSETGTFPVSCTLRRARSKSPSARSKWSTRMAAATRAKAKAQKRFSYHWAIRFSHILIRGEIQEITSKVITSDLLGGGY